MRERFWAKVDKSGDCWEWTGGKMRGGYGSFKDDGGKTVYAHRISWAINCGRIPKGLCVCHHCDNPNCVNPSHLFLGTDKDNKQDSMGKGRHAKGEIHGSAKLTEEDVKLARQIYADGKIGFGQLARRFGVCKRAMWKAIRRVTWKQVE